MKIPFHSCSRPIRFLGVVLSLAMTLAGYGALAMPATAFAATQSPVVDQQPLTVQPTIPPNIVLMLDDSGSMQWSVMPDFSSLSDHSSVNAMRDSAVNGVYYDPTATYSAPPMADSTTSVQHTYPNNADSTVSNPTTFPNAYSNPFFGTTQTQDVTLATGTYGDSSTTTSEFYPFPFYDEFYKQCDSNGNCSYQLDTLEFTPKSNTFTWSHCSLSAYSCISAFAYTTNDGTGYVTHYVASDCKNISNCVTPDDTKGTSAPTGVAAGQNVMNWYSYYSSRIKMAKSGLMAAFSGLNADARVGFGSINGNNDSGLPASTASYSGTTIAQVQPFGDGSSGTQKANFWSWVAGEKASNTTPLRKALDAVGQYYSDTTTTSKAWNTMSSDPNYVAGGTNDTKVACRQAYTILTTDGFWNGSAPSDIPAGTTDKDGPVFNDAKGNNVGYQAVQPFSGGDADGEPSLADVATYYWENDLQPDSSPGTGDGLANEVPTNTDDLAFWQHMVTFTVGLGFSPTGISPDTATTEQIFDWANGGTAIDGFSWPTPAPNSKYNIADLEHAGVNGHGGFYSATTPQTFASAIEASLNRTSTTTRTGAGLAANSTQLTNGSIIYQSTYDPSTWTGDLKAFSINSVNGAIAANASWQTSLEMPAADSRDIETYNPVSRTFVAFDASDLANLSSAQQSALGSDSTSQTDMINYLRGDTSKEQPNGAFRYRYMWETPQKQTSDVLGDIVDSQPVYSGPPDPNEFANQNFLGTITNSSTNTVPFYDWAVGTTSNGNFTASAASTRTALIFVAANDGMLHAFNAGNYDATTSTYDSGTGKEVYAYLPGAVLTAGLKNLSDPAYGSAADPHQYYNDGQLTIADAYIDTGDGNGQSWHTVLVGTTGRGLAEAIYALDVTDPSNIKPLWERSAGDAGVSGDSPSNANTYIGQMTGKPVIAQTNYVPKSGSTPASSTWSVLMGNGYNSASGKAALLQFNLATGALSVHTTTDTTTGNGLAAPVAWMDNTDTNTDASIGVSDLAYAGDLHGHVWSFQLNDGTGANPTPTSTGSLLFTAKDASGNVQPITAGMLAGQDPSTSNVWLFFGTGEYLNSTDLTSTGTQTWYGIIAQSCSTSTKNGNTTTSCTANIPGSRSNLTQRTITGETTAGSNGVPLPARSISTQTINSDGTTDLTGKKGWYLDLVGPNASATDPAERMVDTNEFQGTLLIGVTRIPKVTDVCNPSGSGWIMAVNPFTGAAPSGDFFDVNNDGYVNAGDRVSGSVAAGVGFSSLPNPPIFVGGIMETSFDNGTMSSITTGGTVGTVKRVTWRELVN
ncbi:MAG TPA: PilC/PilY family type IV pilus protein [Rhodanobacteraceae bacterium]|nr:PilC/PilY family type IV pilus protein [Rhodanobacteraceae bacterium]